MKQEYMAYLITAVITLLTIYVVVHYIPSVGEMVGLPAATPGKTD